MISGTSYECIDRTNFSSAAYRRALVFTMSKASRLFRTCPFQRKVELTEVTRLAQAANFLFTTAAAIRPASRRFDVVINTTTTLCDETRMTYAPAFLSKSYALPRAINATP